jgi:hypothetical protein
MKAKILHAYKSRFKKTTLLKESFLNNKDKHIACLTKVSEEKEKNITYALNLQAKMFETYRDIPDKDHSNNIHSDMINAVKALSQTDYGKFILKKIRKDAYKNTMYKKKFIHKKINQAYMSDDDFFIHLILFGLHVTFDELINKDSDYCIDGIADAIVYQPVLGALVKMQCINSMKKNTVSSNDIQGHPAKLTKKNTTDTDNTDTDITNKNATDTDVTNKNATDTINKEKNIKSKIILNEKIKHLNMCNYLLTEEETKKINNAASANIETYVKYKKNHASKKGIVKGFMTGFVCGALSALPVVLAKGAAAELFTFGLSGGGVFAVTTTILLMTTSITAGIAGAATYAALVRKKAEHEAYKELNAIFKDASELHYTEHIKTFTIHPKWNLKIDDEKKNKLKIALETATLELNV